MAVRLSDSAYRFAQRQIKDGHHVLDERDDWSEHRPRAEQENAFIEREGMRAYGHWHLGVDDEKDAQTKAHYKFPYGDFSAVHRCGILAAESRAAQNEYADIEKACAHLHGMLEALR
jgi:hypothetical protein